MVWWKYPPDIFYKQNIAVIVEGSKNSSIYSFYYKYYAKNYPFFYHYTIA